MYSSMKAERLKYTVRWRSHFEGKRIARTRATNVRISTTRVRGPKNSLNDTVEASPVALARK